MQQGPRKVSPFYVPGSIINTASGYVSQRLQIKGINVSAVSACASGAHNIILGAQQIQLGLADVVLVGGSEMALSPLGLAGFSACKALSSAYQDAPETASRPWDATRDGFVMAEGSGVLVLESKAFARARGAKIHAELAGYGMSSDAYHLTSPEPSGAGARMAMQAALDMAEN